MFSLQSHFLTSQKKQKSKFKWSRFLKHVPPTSLPQKPPAAEQARPLAPCARTEPRSRTLVRCNGPHLCRLPLPSAPQATGDSAWSAAWEDLRRKISGERTTTRTTASAPASALVKHALYSPQPVDLEVIFPLRTIGDVEEECLQDRLTQTTPGQVPGPGRGACEGACERAPAARADPRSRSAGTNRNK